MIPSLSSIIAGLKARFERHLAVRRAIVELRGMDEAGLADLGIARDQISAYASGGLPRPEIRRPRPALRVIDGGRMRPARKSAPARPWPVPAGV
jgi:uncharacterized protein YjiS (DUF1127 family)